MMHGKISCLINCMIMLLCLLSEPIEKMSGVQEEKIVESYSITDGIVQSTIEDVLEVSRNVRKSSCLMSLILLPKCTVETPLSRRSGSRKCPFVDC